MKGILLAATAAVVASALGLSAQGAVRQAVFASGYGEQHKYICELTGKPSPAVLVFATAARDQDRTVLPIVSSFTNCGARVEVVRLWEQKYADAEPIREKILGADIVWFSGGMTERLTDRINFYHLADTFREAYRRGTLMTGTSAGSIILTHAGFNDFTDGRYDFIEGLGLLPVYFCPHYQGGRWKEFDARLARETAAGTPADAWALEDGAMVVFRDEQPEVKVFDPKARAHRYCREGGAWRELPQPVRIAFEKDEGWWGGAWDLGGDMPITADRRYVMDLREGCTFQGNASLFVSDRGRWIWSDDPCAFTFDQGVITVEPTRGKVLFGKAGETLRDACRHVSKTFQKPSGKHPDLSFFATPQYCTWIELGYGQTQAAIEKYAADIKKNGFPAGVIMIDDTWQTDYGVWEFDARVFPNPKKLCDDLHRDGFKVMLWACSFVSPDSREYRYLQSKEGVLMAADGSLDFEGHPNTALYNWWNGWGGIVDWTSPAGVAWATEVFQGLCRRYGVDGFKFDATNPRYFSMPNRRAAVPGASSADLSHAFCEFGEQFPMPSAQCWRQGGRAIVVRLTDKGHTWAEAYRCVSDMAVAGLMGCPFVLPDMVGGGLLSSFAPGKKLDQDLFVRSAQSQALSPMIQFSAAPWRVLDAEHLASVKAAVDLRGTFAEKFQQLAVRAGETGEPILRSLEYEFPNQGYRLVKDEFLMGDDLLVIPQLAPGTSREAVIPPGTWRGDDGSVVKGPARLSIEVPLARIPHYRRVKEN